MLQLNTSNANWETKSLELLTTIENNDTDVCIISEANADNSNAMKIYARNNMFKNYSIETKTVNSQTKARNAIVVKKTIPYKRCIELEDDDVSTIVLRIKESKNKSLYIISLTT